MQRQLKFCGVLVWQNKWIGNSPISKWRGKWRPDLVSKITYCNTTRLLRKQIPRSISFKSYISYYHLAFWFVYLPQTDITEVCDLFWSQVLPWLSNNLISCGAYIMPQSFFSNIAHLCWVRVSLWDNWITGMEIFCSGHSWMRPNPSHLYNHLLPLVQLTQQGNNSWLFFLCAKWLWKLSNHLNYIFLC